MFVRRAAQGSVLSIALIAALAIPTAPARAADLGIHGYVTDATTGAPIVDACVTLGPPIVCFTHTDSSGFYAIDLGQLAAQPGSTWDMYFLKNPAYQVTYSEKFVVDGVITFNQPLMPVGQPPACGAAVAGTPVKTAYLPNVTKSLGGPTGWQTPFIAQNTGTVPTKLEVTFSRFLNGQCVARKVVDNLQPGTSFADVPNNDTILPGDTQFAVVVKSFTTSLVAVVNEHAGAGSRAEALAYTGAASGAKSVFLPNITRRFFGYVTPFIIQNLGTTQTVANAKFVSFDGTAPTISVTRTIDPGKSKFVDPNSDDPTLGAPGLADGKQYAVTVTSAEPISVVVNTHNDAPTVASPVAYSTNGISTGGAKVYGAYAARNAGGIGRLTTIVVQNLGGAAVNPTLTFTPLGGGSTQSFISPTPVLPGSAWAFDPRFTVGTTTPCTGPSAGCLGDGEYSFVASASADAVLAAQVNVISPATAMGYSATPTPDVKYYLPNVTRTLGGPGGWTTPILLQSVSASGASLKWYRFSDGALIHTQDVTIVAGTGARVDPRDISALADNTQYSVVIDGGGGTVTAIVMELASGGDNAMIYEGFPGSVTSTTSAP
jgi:hypothetical protein